jgi:AcrR family transcriptional regulator
MSTAGTVRPTSRAIARAAVRAELSLAAYQLVLEKGSENVTLDDMAAAGGVSRSTFLRHFRTKDQAVLIALETYAERIADVLRARPHDEGDWTALRRAIESFVVPIYLRDPKGALAITRLIRQTPALSTPAAEHVQDWRAPLTAALAARSGVAGPAPMTMALKVAAALDCLNLSVAYWAAADGEIDLVDLLEQGFAVLGDETVADRLKP